MIKLIFIPVLLGLIICVGSHPKNPQTLRIINGNTATRGEFPWHVGITRYDTYSVARQCSGAIISKKWILTAAYCLDQAKSIRIHAGSINSVDYDGQYYTASNYTLHEKFNNKTVKNDIALIYINPPMKFDENTKAIALPNSHKKLEEGDTATVSGWGHSYHDDAKDSTYILQYANVTTISNEYCQKTYNKDTISEKVFCTKTEVPNRSPCFGDIGAPLVNKNKKGKTVLEGIFSFISYSSCEDYPAVYTSVAYYRKWIKKITKL